MPTSERTQLKAIQNYLDKRVHFLTPKTLRGYRYALLRANDLLVAHGLAAAPSRWGAEQIQVLVEGLDPGGWCMRNIAIFLKEHKNPILEEMRLRFRQRPRTRGRWLTREQASEILRVARAVGPPYEMAIHLELELGFRRVSCVRSRLQDFAQMPQVVVHGKGHDYLVWAHPSTAEVLARHLPWRDRYLARWTPKARQIDATDHLFPAYSTRKGRTLGSYSESGFDEIVARVAKKSAVTFSNHDLRRTFGRRLWEATGRDTAVVSEALGHRSMDQTRKYLGLGMADLRDAMDKLLEFESAAQPAKSKG